VASAELNLFYRTPDGLKAHIKVVAGDVEGDGIAEESATGEERIVSISQQLSKDLIAAGNTSEEFYRGPAPSGQPQAPTSQGAPGPSGSTVAKVHQACGQPMQYVATGVSKRTGKPYPAFFKCVNPGCMNNGRNYTENA